MELGAGLVKTDRWGQRLARGLTGLGGALLDLAYPPVCLNCDAPVVRADTLCAPCFAQLKPISAPLCPILGLPFAASLGHGALSGEALADPPPFGRARAAVVYDDLAGRLVSRLKYGDRPELALFCARLLAVAGHELWAGEALLVPVPLHPGRHRQRRYNQSMELARALGRVTGLAVAPLLVHRTRQTRQQVGLSGAGRARNVAGAFAADRELVARTRGRRLILIDDVYTTGATVKAVTRALRRGGAAAIDVATFARVVIGEDLPI